jgi:hypothetical protein
MRRCPKVFTHLVHAGIAQSPPSCVSVSSRHAVVATTPLASWEPVSFTVFQYSSGVQFIQIHTMPRVAASRRRPSTRGPRSVRQASKWVRKNMLMDQKKLDDVKRVLRASTETEAVDAALDEIAFRHGLVEGMRALKRAGGLVDLFDER